MTIPEFWDCDSCGSTQTHQTHLANRNVWGDTGFYREPVWLCDGCYAAVGGTCDEG